MRTYIPGDICPHNVLAMSTRKRHISLMRCADIVWTYISRDICPHYILLRFSTQVFVKNSIKGRLSDCIALGEACLKCNLLFMCLISACCSVVWPVCHNFLKCRKIHPNALTGALVRYTYVGM